LVTPPFRGKVPADLELLLVMSILIT